VGLRPLRISALNLSIHDWKQGVADFGFRPGTRYENPRLPCALLEEMPMKVREVINLLEKAGWREIRIRGSHRHFRHPRENWVVTVPGNEGKELARGTLNAILKKAGLK
jgi:predicted RNA binding protein YcfA (HicA-like mRNA interferase family)